MISLRISLKAFQYWANIRPFIRKFSNPGVSLEPTTIENFLKGPSSPGVVPFDTKCIHRPIKTVFECDL